MRTFLYIAGLVIVSLLPNCGPTTKVANIQYPTLKLKEEPEMKQEGLIVTVNPVMKNNEKDFPQIYKTFKIDEGDGNVSKNSGAIVPTPGTFQVKLVNNTGHVVRLSEVVFRLEDDKKNTFPIIGSKDELLAWNQMWLMKLPPFYQVRMASQVTTEASMVPILNRSIELLNGDEWSGFLIFNTNVLDSQGYTDFLAKINRLKLRMAEFPVGLDDAGKVNKTVEFAFNLDRGTAEMAAICPIDSDPSIDNCKLKSD